MRNVNIRERLIIGSLALVAALLAATPWWLRYAGAEAPLASASVLSVILIVAALLATWHQLRTAAAVALAAGGWAMLSPILFGFWDQPAAFWSHMLAGAAALLLAAWEADLDTALPRSAERADAVKPGEAHS